MANIKKDKKNKKNQETFDENKDNEQEFLEQTTDRTLLEHSKKGILPLKIQELIKALGIVKYDERTDSDLTPFITENNELAIPFLKEKLKKNQIIYKIDHEYFPNIQWILEDKQRFDSLGLDKKLRELNKESGNQYNKILAKVSANVEQEIKKGQELASSLNMLFAEDEIKVIEFFKQNPDANSINYITFDQESKTGFGAFKAVRKNGTKYDFDVYKWDNFEQSIENLEKKIITLSPSSSQEINDIHSAVAELERKAAAQKNETPQKTGSDLTQTWQDYPLLLKIPTYIPVAGKMFEKILGIANNLTGNKLKKNYQQNLTPEDIINISASRFEAAKFISKHSKNPINSKKPIGLFDAYNLLRMRKAYERGEDGKVLLNEKGKPIYGDKKAFLLLPDAFGEHWRENPFATDQYSESITRAWFTYNQTSGSPMDIYILKVLDPIHGGVEYHTKIPKDILGIGGPLGRLVYIATPAGVVAGLGRLYLEFRDDIAEFIDDLLIPDFFKFDGPKLKDPARQLSKKITIIEDIAESLDIEKELGKYDPSIDIHQVIEETIQALKEIDEDYNTLERFVNHFVAETVNHSTKVTYALDSAFSKFFRTLGVGKAYEGLKSWADYGANRRKFEKKDRAFLDTLRSKNLSFEQSLTYMSNFDSSTRSSFIKKLDSGKNFDKALEELYNETKKESVGKSKDQFILSAKEQWQSIVKYKSSSYSIQSDLAELATGYGNVLEFVLASYKEKRNETSLKKALEAIKDAETREIITKYQKNIAKISTSKTRDEKSEKEFNSLVTKILQEYFVEKSKTVINKVYESDVEGYKMYKECLNALEELQNTTTDAIGIKEKIINIKKFFGQIKIYREQYINLGDVPIENLARTIEGIEQKIKDAEKKTIKTAKEAVEDEMYIAQNPDYPIPSILNKNTSNMAYYVSDGIGILSGIIFGYIALKMTIKRLFGGYKHGKS